jgi:hypothetical protein
MEAAFTRRSGRMENQPPAVAQSRGNKRVILIAFGIVSLGPKNHSWSDCP